MSLTELDRPAEADEQTDDLVRRAQRGDEAALERLYRRFGSLIYTLALRFVADTGKAEELTQDVFVRVWEKIGSYRWESAFETWLYRLAINRVLSDLRSRGRRSAWELAGEELTMNAHPARTLHPGRILDLERAIASLPTGARAVFLLHDLEGYRHREIAEMTGIAVGTCKAQLHRARGLLREALGR